MRISAEAQGGPVAARPLWVRHTEKPPLYNRICRVLSRRKYKNLNYLHDYSGKRKNQIGKENFRGA
jgi:hypothetical protein